MAVSEELVSVFLSTPGDRVSTGEDSRLRNLDLLRSFAVLCVLFAHMTPVMSISAAQKHALSSVPFGGFGVLLFFVHTALVLMLSMERSAVKKGWVWRFYTQRVFRLYPLSILCVAAVLAFQMPLDRLHAFVWPSASNLLANLMLFQNLQSYYSLSGPMWSLSFEVQMYLLLPGLFWIVRKQGPAGASALVAISILVAVAEGALGGPWISQFFPCFMGGVLAYAMRTRKAVFPAIAWPVAILLLVVPLYGSGFSRWFQWGTCIALGCLIPFFREIPVGAVSRAASAVARYSYGIYLAHLPLRWLCFERLHLPEGARWFLFLILVVAVPIALYHAVEFPMIRFGKRVSNTSHRRPPSLAGRGAYVTTKICG